MLNVKNISFCLLVIAAYFILPELLMMIGIEITTFVMSIAVTALITGLIVKTYRQDGVFKTDRASAAIYQLTKGIMLLYLADLFLLICFDIPISVLHENTIAGTTFSIMIIFIVVLNLARDYSNLQEETANKNYSCK